MIWFGKLIINTLIISSREGVDKTCFTNTSNAHLNNMSSFEIAKSDPRKLEALSFF